MKEYKVLDLVTNPAYLSKKLNEYAADEWVVNSVLAEANIAKARFILERDRPLAPVISLQERREKLAARKQQETLSQLPLEDLGIETVDE